MTEPALPKFLLLCPTCKGELKEDYKDSIQTWYVCEKGHKTANPIKKEIDGITQFQKKFCEGIEQHPEVLADYKPLFVEPSAPYESFCPKDDAGNNLGFKPALVASWLKTNYNFKTDRTTEIFYYYDRKIGCWKDNGEVYLQELLTKLLDKENRQSHYNNVLHDLKGLVFEDVVFSRKIALENGLLDLETSNIELTPFSPEEMPFHSLPVKYDKDAECPNWEEFIKEVVNPDDIATIQEWSGFLLLPDYRFHKLLWIHGEGRNGKGVWQRTMEGVLGEDNFSSVGLEEFDGTHRFALKQLYGSLFNACSEPTTNKLLQTPLLKKATGQDTIDAEIKGKQKRIKFRNCAKITVLANKFPRISDTTTAFKQRRLFIKFPNEYLDTNGTQIQDLENVWLNNPQEKSGILKWMLDGLKRLLAQGHFTESKTQQETEAEFLKASDTISAFLTELGIFDKNLVTTRSEAYEVYKNYCDIFGLEVENDKKFTLRLKETPKITVTLVRKPKQERAWKGLGLKTIDEEGKINQPITFDTLDTLGHALLPPTIVENSKNIGESSTPVSTVSPVSNIDQLKVVSEDSGLRHIEVTPENLALGESNVKDYTQLTCVFCEKAVTENDWVTDDFTWNKPAHRRCYDEKKEQLASLNDKEVS